MSTDQVKTVLVAGDLLWDHNLVKDPSAPQRYDEPFDRTVLFEAPGGAWFLGRLASLVCSRLEKGIRVLAPQVTWPRGSGAGEDDTPPVARAYSLWSPHARVEGSRERVLRVAEFLGCQRVTSESSQSLGSLPYVVWDEPGCAGGWSDGSRDAASAEAVLEPDVLLLDDLCLGFRDDERLWPAALRDGSPRRIVLKLSSSPDASLLVGKLLESSWRDRTTVVVSAATLRSRGAKLSMGLSWDRTIEEIVEEFRTGVSGYDLAGCRRVVVFFGAEGVACFSRCRLPFGPSDRGTSEGDGSAGEPLVWDRVRFERFVYVPDELEGSWRKQRPGRMFGSGSLFAAALAMHELEPTGCPLFIAVARGLAAVRTNLDRGGGPLRSGSGPECDWAAIADCFVTASDTSGKRTETTPPEEQFASAFPPAARSTIRSTSSDSGADDQPFRSNLLRDLTGDGLEYVAAKAGEVIVRGPDAALKLAPKARYGHYLTVDREEIERINAIRSLIDVYLSTPEDVRPLSIAVFGPPGAGKSFAIKQLARTLLGPGFQSLEFNLSQFDSIQREGLRQLHEAFHRVRDAAVKGTVPLVFWDEFDSDGGAWLKHFLAPMQDAEFRAGSVVHPFGKAIFVFAGGTKSTFEEFDRTRCDDERIREAFRAIKGPDFISRLRGTVNIKGPNPIEVDEDPQAAEKDPAHLIRRALIVRSLLERFYPHLIDGPSGQAMIDAGVVRGLLRARRFLHGARSVEAVIRSSYLQNAQRFGAAQLPPPEVLKLHVSDDFLQEVDRGEIEAGVVEALAERFHEDWRKRKEEQGWSWAERRDDAARKHPLLKPYAELSEAQKELNRLPARVVPAKLHDVGLRIERRLPGQPGDAGLTRIDGRRRETLLDLEHDVWLRDHLLRGYQWSPRELTSDTLKLHHCLARFDQLDADDQKLDEAVIDAIPEVLREHGFVLVETKRDSA